MGTKIDTGYEEATEFMDAVPAGEYLARLIEVEEQESASGNPMLVWDFELLEDYPGATVRGWTSLLGHALGECKKYWRAMGFKPWKAGDDLERIARKARQKAKVRLVVGIRKTFDRESGEERENNKIIGIYAADGAASSKGKASPKKTTSKSKGDEIDDDIPF